MNHSQIRNQLLVQVRDSVLARLARYSSCEESKIRQTFLFAADRFCGIRFEIGSFRAQWIDEQSDIQIFRGNRIVDQIAVTGQVRKAA